MSNRKDSSEGPSKKWPFTQREELRQLIGKLAKSTTKLRLTGFVEVEGKIMEAMSQHVFIQENVCVRIVGEKFGLLLVEPVPEC